MTMASHHCELQSGLNSINLSSHSKDNSRITPKISKVHKSSPQKWEDTTGKHPDTVWRTAGELSSETSSLNGFTAMINVLLQEIT